MTSFCYCIKSNSKIEDNELDISMHHGSISNDKPVCVIENISINDINENKNEICNFFNFCNIFCRKSNNKSL